MRLTPEQRKAERKANFDRLNRPEVAAVEAIMRAEDGKYVTPDMWGTYASDKEKAAAIVDAGYKVTPECEDAIKPNLTGSPLQWGMEQIIWIDVETTGLHPQDGHKLLQIAVFVTDNQINLLDEEGYEEIVHYEESELDELKELSGEYVRNMHEKTGLWERLPEGKTLEEIDEEVLAYIKQFQKKARTSWFGGNSIKLDRDFASEFLPKTYEYIHYRSVDVTSIAGMAQAWFGISYEKKGTHNAKDDILESIEELRFYRKHVFK